MMLLRKWVDGEPLWCFDCIGGEHRFLGHTTPSESECAGKLFL